MKRFSILLIAVVACVGLQAQSKRGISILGDSYSTFKGYVVPDTNAVWYPQPNPQNNDVQDVRQLWWQQLIRNNSKDYRLCQNNSFSGATICHTGYEGADYSDRSYCTRLWQLAGVSATSISSVRLWLMSLPICRTVIPVWPSMSSSMISFPTRSPLL